MIQLSCLRQSLPVGSLAGSVNNSQRDHCRSTLTTSRTSSAGAEMYGQQGGNELLEICIGAVVGDALLAYFRCLVCWHAVRAADYMTAPYVELS